MCHLIIILYAIKTAFESNLMNCRTFGEKIGRSLTDFNNNTHIRY